MRLVVRREHLVRGLQRAVGILPTRGRAALHNPVWIQAVPDAVRILSTDSTMSFCGTYQAQVDTEGMVGVQARMLLEIIKALRSGEIVIHSDDTTRQVIVEQDKIRFILVTEDHNKFVDIPSFHGSDKAILSGSMFSEILTRLTPSISVYDSMESLNCMSLVLNENADGKLIEACGLDGHKLSMFRFENNGLASLLPENGILLPRKYLLILRKWLPKNDIELSIENKLLFIHLVESSETFSLPLAELTFPPYQKIMGKVGGGCLLTMDRLEILQCLKRIRIANGISFDRAVEMQLNKTEVTLTAKRQSIVEASQTLAAAYRGELSRIAFPTDDLSKLLASFSSDAVAFSFSSDDGPCSITGLDEPNVVSVIMPMK